MDGWERIRWIDLCKQGKVRMKLRMNKRRGNGNGKRQAGLTKRGRRQSFYNIP